MCLSKQVLSTSPKRLGAGVVKETFDSGEGLRCPLSSALPLIRPRRETLCFIQNLIILNKNFDLEIHDSYHSGGDLNF